MDGEGQYWDELMQYIVAVHWHVLIQSLVDANWAIWNSDWLWWRLCLCETWRWIWWNSLYWNESGKFLIHVIQMMFPSRSTFKRWLNFCWSLSLLCPYLIGFVWIIVIVCQIFNLPLLLVISTDLLNWYIDDSVFKLPYIDMASNNHLPKSSVSDLHLSSCVEQSGPKTLG